MSWPKYKTKDEVPEPFRDEYEEKGGEWVAKIPAPPAGPTAEDLEKVKKALGAEREAREAAEKAAKEAAREAAAHKAGVPEEQAKAWREQAYKEIRAEVQAEADKVAKQLADAQAETRSYKLDARVKERALAKGVLKERIGDWMDLNLRAFELDDKGEPVVKDGKGKTLDDFIAGDLKKARPWLYEGTQASGGGAAGFHGGTGTGGKLTAEEILKNPTEAMNAARAA